jgi:ribosomal protein L21
MKQAIDMNLMDNKYKVQSNEFVRTLEKENFVVDDQVKLDNLILINNNLLFYFKY